MYAVFAVLGPNMIINQSVCFLHPLKKNVIKDKKTNPKLKIKGHSVETEIGM